MLARISGDGIEFGKEQLDFAAGGLIAGKIMWVSGTQFGVQFNEKFDLKLLQPAKPVAKAPTVMAPDYLKEDPSQSG